MTACSATRHGSIDAYNKYRCRCPEARSKKVRANTIHALRKLSGQPGLVDATGTRRRIQALHALGWRAIDLAARLDCTAPAVRQIKWRTTVQRSTAAAVAALYDDLADHHGPSARLRAAAVTWGWLQPLWWDEDTIDDPSFDPRVAYKDTEPSPASVRAVLVENVADLTRKGWSAARVAHQLQVSQRRVVRIRSELRAAGQLSASDSTGTVRLMRAAS